MRSFSLGGQDDLADKRVEALGEFLKTDDGANLLIGVRRAPHPPRRGRRTRPKATPEFTDLDKLTAKEELALAAAIESVKQDTAVADINVESFAGAMRALAELRAPVDAFFDKVTSTSPRPRRRRAPRQPPRPPRAATLTVADFSKIAG